MRCLTEPKVNTLQNGWSDITHLLLLLRCSNMATLSWITPLVLLLLLLLLGLSPRGSMYVCDQPLAETSRIC